MSPPIQFDRAQSHAYFLNVSDALLRQIQQHPWWRDYPTFTYHYCPCPRCDSLDSVRQAMLDWIERELWYNHGWHTARRLTPAPGSAAFGV